MTNTLSAPTHATADVSASGGPSPEIQEWAAETTAAWTKEVKLEWKRMQRRETLLRFRVSKKQQSAEMRCERDQLEREVKRRLAALQESSVDKAGSDSTVAVYRLALESEALRNENVEMHQKLQQLKRLSSLVQERLMDANDSPTEHSVDVNVYKASQTSVWVSCRQENEPGWRVYFPNGEPSFHFHQLTRDEFDAIYKASVEDEFMAISQPVHPVGTLFSWTVYHAPLTRNPQDLTLVAHAKFSMRVWFSLDDVDGLVLRSDLKWLPLIVVPLGWNDKRCEAVSTQVLQEFETDAYIMVCNIPGEIHLRYLQLVRRVSQRLQTGKRSVTYAMTIANSRANSRARAAEEPQLDVVWAHGGANVLIVTEVDGKTVDLTFEFKANARDELHARHLFIYWAQFVCRWSERIVPSRLIETGKRTSR